MNIDKTNGFVMEFISPTKQLKALVILLFKAVIGREEMTIKVLLLYMM